MSSSCWNSLISHARLTEGAALSVGDPEVTEADPGVGADDPVPHGDLQSTDPKLVFHNDVVH